MLIYLIHSGFKKFSIPYIGEAIHLNYISSNLKKNGFYTKVIDCVLENVRADYLISDIKRDSPEVIIISFYEANHAETIKFIRELKNEKANVNIVLMGIYFTLNTEKIIKELSDLNGVWGIRGEGEEIIISLMNKLVKVEPLFMREIVYILDNKIYNIDYVNIVANIDDLPFPDTTVMERLYGKVNVPVYILSSRGCYGNCSFCILNIYNSIVTKCNKMGKWRERQMNSVVDEMEEISKKFPNALIKFADSNFIGLNPRRGMILSQKIKERNLSVKFSIECRANDIDEQLFKELKSVGLVTVFIGIESGCQKVLKRYHKDTTIEQNQYAIDTIRKLNIGLKMGFILFDEYSTLDELKINTEFLHHNNSCVFHPYRPLVIENFSHGDIVAHETIIRDVRTRIAYKIIKNICEKFLPYKRRIDIIRKNKCYDKSFFEILGKFAIFDKHGMLLIIKMCQDSRLSCEKIEAKMYEITDAFLNIIESELSKYEDENEEKNNFKNI